MQSSKQAIADSSTKLLKKEETTIALDNSRPGRSGLDELVPSRYALKVGEIDVMVVSDGVLSLPGAMLGHNVDPAVRGAWLEHNFLPPDVLAWALNVVVVKSGDRTILIDAGLGADPDLNLPRAGRLIQRLEAAGIDLTSVTDVVLTHLHMDHIGGPLAEARPGTPVAWRRGRNLATSKTRLRPPPGGFAGPDAAGPSPRRRAARQCGPDASE